MKKFLIVLGVILVLILGFITYVRLVQTKQASPEEKVILTNGDLKVSVYYNRPFKKGRDIFGGLVPYDVPWRTGANEATVFETNRDLNFAGKPLKAGKYSLFTIPGEQEWSIILNSESGQWGIKFNGEINRDPAKDVLVVEVLSVLQEKEFEQFTISLEKSGGENEMILMWDKTLVSIPFSAR
ncbi:MAG: DUF2911 domain-containing protein [Cyclobacteriaceae bacterium]|nr:DUF2911 domain-containing protein [Cyclobacteriaceae bacterium]